MADFMSALTGNAAGRKLLGSLGVPLPARLPRDLTPWRAQELAEVVVTLAFPPGAALADPIAVALAEAGASSVLVDDGPMATFASAGEAWSRPPRKEEGGPVDSRALVIDATGVSGPAELRALYDFFRPRLRSLEKGGRAIVLGRPHLGAEPARTARSSAAFERATVASGDGGGRNGAAGRPGADDDGASDAEKERAETGACDRFGEPGVAAARRALEGFVRSLGRELGRYGSTSQLVIVDVGAEDRLAPVLRFLLSPRSAFVSGQVWHVSAAVAATPPRWTRPLEGKVALVTGAARGIGEATARALAREGARVIVLDLPRDEEAGTAVASACGGTFLGADLADPGAVHRVAGTIQERHARLDILVQNAGITRDKTLANMPEEVWDLTLDVNLAAVLRLHGALAPLYTDHARVVCLSSIAGIAGNVGQTNYSASKAGVIGVVESLAPRLAPRGIAVNAIAPGFIETRMTAAIPVGTREVARRLANLAQGGLPEDIAEVATFLASPGAAGLSGRVLRVCGGSFIGA